jgi:hypothetical protein
MQVFIKKKLFDMKYIISEAQYGNLKEQFDFEGGKDFEEESQFLGTQSPATLALIDILVREGILDLELISVSDDEITIFGLPEYDFFDYFMDNQINFEVENVNGNISVDVTGDDEDEDYELYEIHLDEIFDYIEQVSKKVPFIDWYINGEPI